MIPFIVGVGRSGTTLLRLMLDSHADLAIPPETHFIPQLIQDQTLDYEQFVEIIIKSPTWFDFGIEKMSFKNVSRRFARFQWSLVLESSMVCMRANSQRGFLAIKRLHISFIWSQSKKSFLTRASYI